jgi:hypothetical protein
VTWRFLSLCGGVEVAFYRTHDGHVKKVLGVGEGERERVSTVAYRIVRIREGSSSPWRNGCT